MSIPVITISREYGSGGRAIGEKLAKELGIPFYNKELILMAAKESGLSEEYIKKAEQQKSTSFLYGLYMGAQQLPMNDQIFLIQSKIIREIAEKGPCVIVGRCADYVLRNQSGVDALNLFIHAPMEERIRRVREEYKVQAPDLRLYILKQDKNRAAYYEHFTDGQWGKAQNYHLAVSSGLGLETIVRLLTDLMRDRGLGA